MTDNKLTLQDCFKYPEAPIKHSSGKIKSVFELIIWAYNLNLSVSFILKNYECKLILRDITQLTDGEKEYLSKFLSITYREVEKYLNGQEMLNFAFKESLHIADYLREHNIMIEKPDWFKSGKAVKGK